jgi:signal transduction histidine kinase
MKRHFKKILPYLITSLLVIGFWKLMTWTEDYAWNPEGKELLMLDIALTSIFFYKTIFWLVTANLLVFGLFQLKKKNFITAGIVIAITLSYHFAFGQVIDKKCAFHYYSVFLNQSRPEPLIVKPIEEAGYEIGPLLTEKIKDKKMKSRRYAILGLQKIDYQPATELMGEILFDNSELEFYRADAYGTLKYFDNEKSNKLLNEFKRQANDSLEIKIVELGEYFYKHRKK